MPACWSCAADVAAELAFCPRCGAVLNDPLIGAVIGDRYRIVERIGVGGMGTVYRAEHTMMRRDLAIKVLLPDLGGKDEFARRFVREAESASRLTHPNIITVTDFGRTADGLLFLVMEYLAGQSLTSVIRQGPVPLPRALAIIRQILAALRHAHAGGVVHRDLKPDNIMLIHRDGRDDVVKILDFGIAKVSEPSSGEEALTQAGVVFGTPEYLSPEQALGETVDARADIYAAGVILFEMLTGRRPYDAKEKVRIISMHLSHPLPRMRDVNPDVLVPAPLEELVLQALEKNRDHRFSSAAAFMTALDEAEALSAPGTPPPLTSRPSATAFAETAVGPSPLKPSATERGARAERRDQRNGLFRGHPRRVVAAAAALGLAGIAVIVIVATSSDRPSNRLASAPDRPATVPVALETQIRRVELLLASGEIIKARAALAQLLAEHPRNARIRYLLGRLAFAENRHGDALDDYREAIALDAGFRGDPVLLEHVGEAIGESRHADDALDLVVTRIGQPAVEILARVVNDSGDFRRRERAARALEDLGEGKRVDWVALRLAALKRASTCEDRKPIVVELGNAGDPRALPALRAQRSRGGLSRLFGAADTNCMTAELADAVAKLEAKLPADKRPPPPAKPQRRSTSFLRGR